ncbi:MAG: PAS domain S-box protein [Betaproteobacteria bacterium]|nr:PAS domain S-box protein [Betaproteobacteria bacterium]
MKISTRLYFALALTAIMIAAIGAIYALLEESQRQGEEDSDAGRILVGQIAALHSLAHEYAAISQPRIERQWQLQISRIRERVKSLNALGAVRSLEISLDNADRAFARLRQNHVERITARKRAAGAEDMARFDAVEGAVHSLMRLEIEKLLSSAELIAVEAHQRIDALRGQAAAAMAAVVVLFLTLVVAITLPATIKTTRSISSLIGGVSAFGRGDFVHRVAIEGNDEMALLAKQFNAMAETIEGALQREREHAAALQREINDRNKAEGSLRRSEEQYRAFFELAAVGLAQADLPGGRLVRVNDRYCEIVGYSRAEVLGMTIFDLTHPEDRERNARRARRLFAGEVASLNFEKRILRKDGTTVWVLVNATLPRDTASHPKQSVAVYLDITGRKQAEEESRLSRQRLALHVQQTPLAVIEFDVDGRVRDWNPAAFRLFGYSREEAIGQHWSFILPESRTGSSENALQSAVTQHGSRSSNENRTRDGRTLSCEWFNTPLVDPDGKTIGVASLVMDVTERKRFEAALERSARELRQAYRRLAHAQETERRSLTKELHDRVGQNLSALHLHLQLMERELSKDSRAKAEGRLDDMLGLLEQTSEQVRDLMANQRPPMLDQYGLFATLRWLAHETSQRSGIACALIGTEPAQRLPGDVESTLLRIAQEALMNAVKYSKTAQIRIAMAVFPDRARIEVADEGIGFDPAARNGTDSKPTWGLLTMRERALAFGGSLHIDTAPGAGTRVTAEIPIA